MIYLFGVEGTNRMILHSLLGSATIGTFLSLVATILIYPFLVSRLFHVDEKRVENKCKFSFAVAFSVFVGNISHVLLDMTNHPYNPVFWPFLPAIATPNPIYFALGDPFGYLWMQIIMAVLLLALIVIKRNNLFDELLVG